LFDLIKTRFWKDLPLFNCLDIKSVIIGIAASGPEPPNGVSKWTGDAADRDAGKLTVKLGGNGSELHLSSGE